MVWLIRRRPPIIKKMFRVFLEKKFEGAYIKMVYRDGDVLYANITLPAHKERSDLEKLLPNLQQEVKATAVKIGKVDGKDVELQFGMNELDNIVFDEKLLHPDSLKVEFPSAFGKHILDFEDGASCHLLNGGATRMGKTIFMLYLMSTIFLQNKGNVKFYISSAKLKDFYPFEGLRQVQMCRDEEGMEKMLEEIVDEYKKRDALLYSTALRKATDAKSVRKNYPSHYHLFKPIFVFIDEYARFAANKRIQEMVTEIVETAGFVNVHVVIASQRPDASTVLRPRIRANLLTRMAFTTVDKKNSEIILDAEGAEKLGKIAGRGLIKDSDITAVQVPYLDAVKCDELMEVYRDEQNRTRQDHNGNADEIQSVQPESTSMVRMPDEFESSERSESSVEAYDPQWLYNSDPKGEG